MSVAIPVSDARRADQNSLAPWTGFSVRLKRASGRYWVRGGTTLGDVLFETTSPQEATVWPFEDMLAMATEHSHFSDSSLEWAVDYDRGLNRIPSPTLADSPSPSTASPRPPNTPQSTRSPNASPGTDGKGVRLLAVPLPAFDLLSGSADTLGVVLELASFETSNGRRNTLVGWHGPFPTPREASDFAALLAARPPTTPGEPSAGQRDHNALSKPSTP